SVCRFRTGTFYFAGIGTSHFAVTNREVLMAAQPRRDTLFSAQVGSFGVCTCARNERGNTMTRRHPGATVYLLVLFALVPLASCQKPFHDKEERYAFIATNVSLPYWQEAKAGFMESAHVLGVQGGFSGPSTYAPDA